MEKHTPTPWEIEQEQNDKLHIVTHRPEVIATLYADPLDEEARANAELIVKAVNNHEQLVKALTGLTKYFEFMIKDPSFEEYRVAKELLKHLESNPLTN